MTINEGTARGGALLALVGALLFAILATGLGYFLATHYVPRLPDHRGLHLVAVADAVKSPSRTRARRTLVVVVDGLRMDHAVAMRSVAQLRARGQCLRMDVGLPTVSRPVYAMLSTGLEQDRTGARNNEEKSPLAAESVWQVFREAGLRVEGRSELPWWLQLFPTGFDRYVEVAREADAFPAVLSADVTLVHPVYVDETAHSHGAASALYRESVSRVDAELAALLGTMDLDTDLVAFTADHGHRDRGGHGGPSDEVQLVLSCFAGRGVATAEGLPDMDGRAFGPALTVLLGTRFPRHMRAGEDGLAVLDRIASPALGAAFLEDRRAAVATFREANRAALVRGGAAGEWSQFYQAERRAQLTRAVGALLAMAALFAVAARWRRWTPRGALWQLLVVVAVAGGFLGLYAGLSGGIDASSLNMRAFFVRNTLQASGIALAVLVGAHFAAQRLDLLQETLTVVVAAAILANTAHVVVFGWPMGFPQPPPLLYFMPFLSSTFLFSSGLLLLVVTLLGAARSLVRPKNEGDTVSAPEIE